MENNIIFYIFIVKVISKNRKKTYILYFVIEILNQFKLL